MNYPNDITVAIVTHNAKDRVGETINCLLKSGCLEESILVVDSGSEDGCPEFIEQNWPKIKIKKSAENVGPSIARNIAFKECLTKYLLLVDDDVSVNEDTCNIMYDEIKNDDSVGIVSPIVVYANSENTIQYAGTHLHFLCEASNLWQGKILNDRGLEKVNLGVAPACALLIRVSAAKEIGLFDEKFFLGKEDGDFTHRLVIAGYKIVENPKAVVTHYKRERGSKFYTRQLRNRWYLILKTYQKRTILGLAPILIFQELFQFIILLVQGHVKEYIPALKSFKIMCNDLRADRKKVKLSRMINDSEILYSKALVIPTELLRIKVISFSLKIYELFLNAYWSIVKGVFFKLPSLFKS